MAGQTNKDSRNGDIGKGKPHDFLLMLYQLTNSSQRKCSSSYLPDMLPDVRAQRKASDTISLEQFARRNVREKELEVGV